MRRRECITLRGSATAAWPLTARAQQAGGMRRIAVLMPFAKSHPEGQARNAAFLQELQKLGWTEGRNLQIEYRWETGDLLKAATELVASSPDVMSFQLHSSRRGIATDDPDRADRIYAGGRSRQRWLCDEPGEAWRQHHRVHKFRLRHWCEMGRTA